MAVEKDPEQNETKYLRRQADARGKRILEVGCGDGRLTWRYAEAARRVSGIDLDREGLRVASIERASDLEHVATFAQADSVHLPFPTQAFDIAILSWSF
jgi:ubiquinone/menaquinone biosynthesis C-methylase UbiE